MLNHIKKNLLEIKKTWRKTNTKHHLGEVGAVQVSCVGEKSHWEQTWLDWIGQIPLECL